MWPFWKTQFWVIAVAANASLWIQLCIEQTPTYLRQRTVSPLTAARILQNRFTFCCPALLWPGKRPLKLLRAFSGKCGCDKQFSFSITRHSKLLMCFCLRKKERRKHTVHKIMVSQVNKKGDTHTRARTGRTSHRNSGSSHTGRSCRMDGRGDHMAGSCTPDWTSYLEQQRTKPSDWHSKLCYISEGIV